jgi:hypothetical protein
MGNVWWISTLAVLLFRSTFLSAAPLSSQSASPNEKPIGKITFGDFIKLVAHSHPQQAIDQISLGISQTRDKKSGRLADPQISLTGEDFPFKMRKEDMGSSTEQMANDVSKPKWTFNLTQSFPWPGTLAQEKKQAEVLRQRDQVINQIDQIRRLSEAQILYIDMVTFNQLIQSEQENLREVENIFKSAQTRLKYGVGSHHDSIEAHHEKILLQLTIEAMKENLEVLKERAAQMLGHGTSEGLEFDLHEKFLTNVNLSSHVPADDLAQVQISLDQGIALEKKELEQLRSSPTLMAGGMVMKMQGDASTNYGFMVGMSVPLFGGTFREGADEEYSLATKKAIKSRDFYEKQKKFTLRTLERREKIARAQFEGLKTQIVPSAQEHLRTISVEYGIGKTPFATVNRARRQLLKYQEAKIYAERELLSIKVARERVSYGILEKDLDAMMPQITGSDGMGVDSKSMGSMENDLSSGTMPKAMSPSNGRQSLQRRRPDSRNPMEDQEETSPSKGSMGEM